MPHLVIPFLNRKNDYKNKYSFSSIASNTKSVCTLLMLTNVVKEERKSNEVEDRKMEREEKDVEGQVEAKNRGALKLTETNLG